ncbi:glycosyltransferase family 1 protein [Cupriavidus sp. AU9028]|uniref:glycosyltransferase family 4 protein n=1 Tax=Cupriavidus sp. AU9028 TaxID=2871157 RepID=UPI001C958F1F|nr:glycosyltransferase family 1 protein [Cupriavidus sp. AU9028]MBY4896848.1 glycosyltransferase family 4 protein [Cupriavidus sp. AU9028]
MIKVGFVFGFQDRGWMGGINYFRNLLWAINLLPRRSIEPVIFTGRRTPQALLDGLPPISVVRTALLDRKHPLWMARKAWQAASGRDLAFERYLLARGISVLSHHGPLGAGARLPTVGWIPDFQHLHLPQLFPQQEIVMRERLFGALCAGSARVLVSSRHALRDLQRAYPQHAERARVLQFVANMSPLTAVPPVAELERRYRFRGPYFHLPNQLWQHKNHGVVVQALRVLKDSGRHATVVCTGETVDHRNPGYRDAMLAAIREAGVEDRMLLLGVVPYADLSGLMRGAVAMINPSRFEGWSTTVEEAKSTGKRILLSDIEVHREQAPARGVYFAPDDARALAGAMADVLDERIEPAAQAAFARAARDDLERRRHAFARTYQEIVLELVQPAASAQAVAAR